MSSVFPTNLDNFSNPVTPGTLNTPPHHTQHGDANDAIENIEARVGITNSLVTTSHAYKLSTVTTGDKVVSVTGTQTLTNKTLTSPILDTPRVKSPDVWGSYDGWIYANDTWHYASSNSITVGTGGQSRFMVGDRIKVNNPGTPADLKYGTIIAVADTLITLAINTDYVIVNVGSMTGYYYSHEASPVGFPKYFNYTPTITYSGGTTNPTSNTINKAYFSVNGRLCTFYIQSTIVRGSGDRAFTIYTLPITRADADYLPCISSSSFNSAVTFANNAYTDSTTLVKVPVTMNQDGVTQVTGSYWI